jgi:glutamate dehydrogenase (NAD(P)+)
MLSYSDIMIMLPELSIAIGDNDLGLLGYLVIDTTIDGRCSGGVRIMPHLTLDEMSAIARTMTLKYGFLGFSLGGAKAGVIVPADASRETKHRILHAFGQKIGPFIKKGIYIPATDMNCCIEDLKSIYQGADMKARFREFQDISHVYTSWTVVESAIVAAERLSIPLRGSTAAIEGLGKVGIECAKLLHARGVRICAVSTLKGAIHNESGLDVEHLIRLRNEYGDDFVNHSDETRIALSEIVTLKTDMLIPAAQTNSINPSNRGKVQAKIVSCAANSPMDAETYKALHDKGIVVIPDAVANCGGVLGSFLERSMTKKAISILIRDEFTKVIGNLIDRGHSENRSIYAIAVEISMNRFKLTKDREEKRVRSKVMDYTQMQATRLFHRLRQEKYRHNIFGDLLHTTRT